MNFVGPFIHERDFANTHTASLPHPRLHLQIPSIPDGKVFSIVVGNPWMRRADCRYSSTPFPSGDVSIPGFRYLRGPWIEYPVDLRTVGTFWGSQKLHVHLLLCRIGRPNPPLFKGQRYFTSEFIKTPPYNGIIFPLNSLFSSKKFKENKSLCYLPFWGFPLFLRFPPAASDLS